MEAVEGDAMLIPAWMAGVPAWSKRKGGCVLLFKLAAVFAIAFTVYSLIMGDMLGALLSAIVAAALVIASRR